MSFSFLLIQQVVKVPEQFLDDFRSLRAEINHSVLMSAALGVQLLRFVLLMKLELQDATDTLDVFLWRDAVSLNTHQITH